MRKWFSWVLAVTLFAAIVFQSTGQAQPTPTGAVSPNNGVKAWDKDGNETRFTTFVTLYKNGEAVRSMELRGFDSWTKWDKLIPGAYEVHFEAKGYGKVIKKVAVVAEKNVDVWLTSMDKNDEVWGAGPTLYELQTRIKTLEDEVLVLKKTR